MPCFYKKRKQPTDALIDYHQRAALRALGDIHPAEEYTWRMESHNGTFSMTHIPSQRTVSVTEQKLLEYWIDVLTAIQKLEDTIEILSYQR